MIKLQAYCLRIRKPQIWPRQLKMIALIKQLWPLPEISAAFAIVHKPHKYPWRKQNAGPSSQQANVPCFHSPEDKNSASRMKGVGVMRL